MVITYFPTNLTAIETKKDDCAVLVRTSWEVVHHLTNDSNAEISFKWKQQVHAYSILN